MTVPQPKRNRPIRPDPGGSGEIRDGDTPGKKRFSAQQEEGLDWEQALVQAATNARAMGQLPKGVARMVKAQLRPTLSWEALLAKFIQQSARKDYTLDAAQSKISSPGPLFAVTGIRPVA